MKPQHIILIFVLVAVVFVGTIFLFIFKTFSGPTGPRTDSNLPTNVASSTNSTNPTSSSTTPDSGNLTVPDNHTALDDCIELKAYEAKGKTYEKGSLLVSFYSAVEYSLAVESIKLLGLNTDENSDSRNNFNQNHWLTVRVPTGKEFEWQCTLDASEGIKKANLNLTFNLHQ